jgi:GTPase SAR1 family protein
MKPKLFVLVGPPSVGKSMWIKSTFKNKKPYVINRDDIVDEVLSGYGWTYDDMFVTLPEDANIGDTDEKAPGWMTWTKTVFSTVFEANKTMRELEKIVLFVQ